MVKVADLRADLTLSTASFESATQRARREMRQFQQQVSSDTSAMQKSFASLQTSVAGFAKGLIAGVGVAGAATIFGRMVTEVKEAEVATARLTAGLKAAGNTSGLSARQIGDYADQVAKATLQTSESVTQAAARLNSFGAVAGTQFKEVLSLAADLSSAIGGDLASNVDRLGRALVNPVEGLTGLTRSVKAFSPEAADAAQQLAKMGDIAGAQTVILKELSRVIGGSAEAEGGTLAGSLHRASESLGNFLERASTGTGLIAGFRKAVEALSVGLDKLAQPAVVSDTIREKQQEVLALTAKRDGPGLGGSLEEEQQRKAAIDLRIARLRDEIDQITAASLAEQERAAIAEKAAQDAANAAQIKLKAEAQVTKAVDDGTRAVVAQQKAIVDGAAERARQRQGELDSILAAAREEARVAAAVEEQRVRAAKDAAEQIKKEQEEAARAMQAVWDDIAVQIKNALAAGIRGGMEGEIQTAQQVATTIKDIFLTASSQIASMAIMNPAQFMQMTSGMGTFESLAPSLFGGTGLGDVSVGSTFAAAGLGAAGGGILAGLFGGNSTGGSVGGGLGAAGGAILGSIFPGIGTVLGGVAGGALGSIIGGLFGGGGGGGGDHNDNYRASFVNGTFANVQNTKPSEGNVNNVTQVGQQIAALYAALQGRGGTFSGTLGLNSGNQDGLQLTTAAGTKNYDNVQQLSLAAAKALIAGTEGLSGLDRQILGRSKATDAAGLIADLQFADTFQQLTGAVTPFVAELKNLLREFDKQDKKAKELGLSVADLNRAQEKQLATLRAQKSAQIVSLQSGYRSAVEGAFSFAEPIDQLRAELSGGGTARARLGTARADFERVRRQVAAGQVEGFNALPAAAQALLAAGRENFATGSGYGEIARLVQRVLDSADVQIDAVRDPLLEGVGKVDQTLADVGKAVEEQRDAVVAELKALRRDIRALDRAA